MMKEQEKNPSSPSPNPYSLIPVPLRIADIVISINGRDAGKKFIVIETETGYSLIADGKGRKYEKPKRKKNKHLKVDNTASGKLADKLISGEKVTNSEIRRFLAAYAAHNSDRYEVDEQSKKEGCTNAKRRHDRT